MHYVILVLVLGLPPYLCTFVSGSLTILRIFLGPLSSIHFSLSSTFSFGLSTSLGEPRTRSSFPMVSVALGYEPLLSLPAFCCHIFYHLIYCFFPPILFPAVPRAGNSSCLCSPSFYSVASPILLMLLPSPLLALQCIRSSRPCDH